MKTTRLIATAIDLGHANVKAAYPGEGHVETFCYPALAPLLPSGRASSFDESHRPDGITVTVGSSAFFIGPDACQYMPTQGKRPAQDGYVHSPEYRALMLGTLGRIAVASGATPGDTVEIMCLALGLPLTTYEREKANLEKRWAGEHVVPVPGGTVTVAVRDTLVLAQPLGALIQQALKADREKAAALASEPSVVFDVGGGTLDFLTTLGGIKIHFERSGATRDGMDACVAAIAHQFGGADGQLWQSSPGIVRKIDQALATGCPIQLGVKTIATEAYEPIALDILRRGLEAAIQRVGLFTDVGVILCVGGGGRLFAKALVARLPEVEPLIVCEGDPVYSNVRGFFGAAHRKGASLARSLGLLETV